MERSDINNAAMFATGRNAGPMNLQPFNLAIGQLLEERGNRYASGAKFKPKISELNELIFLFCHDIETVLAVPDEAWTKEVIRFAASLSQEQIDKVQEHVERELERMQSSATTSGKKAAAGTA